MVRFAAMSWFKTAVICLCIIGGFVGHSYIDRHQYFINISSQSYGRIDKWTGEYTEWSQEYDNDALKKLAGEWESPSDYIKFPTHR